jgi:ABC-type branched-subunit amino acid transport system ATPase component
MKDSNISATLAHESTIKEFTELYKQDYELFKKLTQQENLNLGYVRQDV